MRRLLRGVPFVVCALFGACAPKDAIVSRCQTHQGLLELTSYECDGDAERLEGPSTQVLSGETLYNATVHFKATLTVAQGAMQVSYTDVAQQQHAVTVTPGTVATLEGDAAVVRAKKAFLLTYTPQVPCRTVHSHVEYPAR